MADDLIRRSDAVRVVRDFIERPVFLQPSLYEALNAIPAATATSNRSAIGWWAEASIGPGQSVTRRGPLSSRGSLSCAAKTSRAGASPVIRAMPTYC